MTISLGIRLVILFPTMLFLTGFILKGMIELKRREKSKEEELKERRNDFFFIFAIESIFLFIANGLILIFELEQSEFGVITIILGVVIPIFLLVGSLYDNDWAIGIGFFGAFGLLFGEFCYFSSYGLEIMIGTFSLETILSVTGFIIGIVVGLGMSYLINPYKKNTI